jgi:putative transposase
MGCTSAHDNAVAESFFASLTKNLLRRRHLRSRDEARTAVFDYIETFYNRLRLHSTLDYLSPVDYEKMKDEQARAKLRHIRTYCQLVSAPPLVLG